MQHIALFSVDLDRVEHGSPDVHPILLISVFIDACGSEQVDVGS